VQALLKQLKSTTREVVEYTLTCICSLSELFPIFDNHAKDINELIFRELKETLKRAVQLLDLVEERDYISKLLYKLLVINVITLIGDYIRRQDWYFFKHERHIH
jgi:hypothetical protein